MVTIRNFAVSSFPRWRRSRGSRLPTLAGSAPAAIAVHGESKGRRKRFLQLELEHGLEADFGRRGQAFRRRLRRSTSRPWNCACHSASSSRGRFQGRSRGLLGTDRHTAAGKARSCRSSETTMLKRVSRSFAVYH